MLKDHTMWSAAEIGDNYDAYSEAVQLVSRIDRAKEEQQYVKEEMQNLVRQLEMEHKAITNAMTEVNPSKGQMSRLLFQAIRLEQKVARALQLFAPDMTTSSVSSNYIDLANSIIMQDAIPHVITCDMIRANNEHTTEIQSEYKPSNAIPINEHESESSDLEDMDTERRDLEAYTWSSDEEWSDTDM